MQKDQILTAVLVAALVVAAAIYRLLWTGSSSAAAAGLRQFPKTPGKLVKWLFGGKNEEKDRPA